MEGITIYQSDNWYVCDSILRKLSVQYILYIDDRFIVSRVSDREDEEMVIMEARKLVYVMVELQV